MIIDKISNSKLYEQLHPNFEVAFEYLKSTDFSTLANGEYELKEREIFAIVNSYQTKSRTDESAKLEAHRQYIDIQYVAAGEEQMGYTPLDNQEPIIEYNRDGDYQFFKGDASFITVTQGLFAIFFPQDLHMPGIISNIQEEVKKVVVKIRVN